MQSEPCHHTQLEALRRQISQLEGILPLRKAPAISSGCEALDQILPEQGFLNGTLVEWLAEGDGTGATALALLAASQACRSGGGFVVVDASREFYPPAAVREGIDPARLIVVQPGGKADLRWALDQSLRSTAVAAVMAWPDSRAETLDGRTFRRLQLAAEEGGGLGLLIRPQSVLRRPSWARVRLLVEPLPNPSFHGGKRRFRVFLLHGRGVAGERCAEVEIDDETHLVPMAARLPGLAKP